jgi:hypothetical protein
MPPCLGEQEQLAIDHILHLFPLKILNAILHESCVPRETGQLSYWEILKCLGEIWRTRQKFRETLSYGPPWAHYLDRYQDRLLGGPLGLPGLRYTAPDGVEHKDYRGELLG